MQAHSLDQFQEPDYVEGDEEMISAFPVLVPRLVTGATFMSCSPSDYTDVHKMLSCFANENPGSTVTIPSAGTTSSYTLQRLERLENQKDEEMNAIQALNNDLKTQIIQTEAYNTSLQALVKIHTLSLNK